MDLFYYGSQDAPLPLWGRRSASGGAVRRGEPAFCEACNRSIPDRAFEQGSASEVFGLALCGECRDKAQAEDRVELYFCDRCQVSVPVYRVESGEALEGDGRILCLSCRAHGRAPLLRRAAIVILLLALGALGALAVRPGAAPSTDLSPAELLREALSDAGAEPFAERWASLSDRLAALSSELVALRAQREEVLERLARANGSALTLRGELDLRLGRIEEEIARIRDDVELLLNAPLPTR